MMDRKQNQPLYQRLKKLGMFEIKEHKTIKHDSESMMPLSIEWIGGYPWPVLSIMHYGIQNGDLMRDPEMLVRVDHKLECAEAFYFKNDYAGFEDEGYVFDDDLEILRIKVDKVKDMNFFLRQWLDNLSGQQYKIKS